MNSEFMMFFMYIALAFSWTMYITQELFISGSSALNVVLVKNEGERKQIQSSSGLHFNGVEVWLIAALAMTEGTFPKVFSTIFKHLYVIVFLLLFILITRGISAIVIYLIDDERWRKSMIKAWTTSSFLIMVFLGVYVSNLFFGFPYGANGMEQGFLSAIHSTSIAVSILFLLIGLISGTAWINITTSNELGERSYLFIKKYKLLYVVPFVLLFVYYGYYNNNTMMFLEQSIATYVLASISIISSILLVWRGIIKDSKGVLILSILTMVLFMTAGFTGNYPYLVASTIDPTYGLTTAQTVVSYKALQVLFIAIILLYPIVISYQTWKYLKFSVFLESIKEFTQPEIK